MIRANTISTNKIIINSISDDPPLTLENDNQINVLEITNDNATEEWRFKTEINELNFSNENVIFNSKDTKFDNKIIANNIKFEFNDDVSYNGDTGNINCYDESNNSFYSYYIEDNSNSSCGNIKIVKNFPLGKLKRLEILFFDIYNFTSYKFKNNKIFIYPNNHVTADMLKTGYDIGIVRYGYSMSFINTNSAVWNNVDQFSVSYFIAGVCYNENLIPDVRSNTIKIDPELPFANDIYIPDNRLDKSIPILNTNGETLNQQFVQFNGLGSNVKISSKYLITSPSTSPSTSLNTYNSLLLLPNADLDTRSFILKPINDQT